MHLVRRSKLLHQAMLLVAIPLIFEIGFVALLSHMVAGLESTVVKEANAKDAVAVLTGFMRKTVALQILMVESRLIGDAEYDAGLAKMTAAIKQDSLALKTVVKSDRQASVICTNLLKHVDRLVRLLPQLKEAVNVEEGNYFFAQFLRDKDFWTEVLFNTKKVEEYAQELIDYYSRTIDETRPLEARSRQELKQAILIMLMFNVVIAIGLAANFSRTSAKRLAILMNNVKRFGRGEREFDKLDGEDEIAELDMSFQSMADARYRAEQARRDMVAMVSHDLRTPLCGCLGYLTLTTEGVYGQLPQQLLSVLTKMECELERMMRLTNDLLDIEKIESGALVLEQTESELSDIVDPSMIAVRGIAELKEVAVMSEFDPYLLVRCDQNRIIQVLVNLLSNSVKFSPSGKCVKLVVSQNSAETRFEVHDEGPGIPAEKQAEAFERFKQLDQKEITRKAGSGLGLTICKAIIDAHGGTIGVTSTPGNGACFWFTLRNSAVTD